MQLQLNNEIVRLRVAVLSALAQRCGLRVPPSQVQEWAEIKNDSATFEQIKRRNRGFWAWIRRMLDRFRAPKEPPQGPTKKPPTGVRDVA